MLKWTVLHSNVRELCLAYTLPIGQTFRWRRYTLDGSPVKKQKKTPSKSSKRFKKDDGEESKLDFPLVIGPNTNLESQMNTIASVSIFREVKTESDDVLVSETESRVEAKVEPRAEIKDTLQSTTTTTTTTIATPSVGLVRALQSSHANFIQLFSFLTIRFIVARCFVFSKNQFIIIHLSCNCPF
jgi:ABC-type Na+ efflux pump permease subunit